MKRPVTKHLTLLLKKYQQKIYWHVRRMVIDHDDADDIVQDVFIKIWKNLPGFVTMRSCIPGCTALPLTNALLFEQEKSKRTIYLWMM
jgi:hypothetical protein